jgi:hypothetical protein
MKNKMADRSCGGRKTFLAASSISLLTLFAPLTVPAANPEPIGRMEIVSLTDFAGNAGKLAEKISPGLQALPFLGIIALTLNPEYQALDFSAPVSVFIYSKEDKFLWCAAVGGNGSQKLPATVKFLGHEAFVKKLGNRVGLSYSSPLLNSINALPPVIAPAKDDNLSTLLMTLDVARYLNGCKDDYNEFRNKYLERALLKNLERNHGRDPAEKMKKTAEEVEKLICQIGKMTVWLNVLPDYIDVRITVEAAAGSDLSEFISRQSQNKIQLMPVVKNKAITASVDMESAPDMIRRLPGLLFEFQNDPQLQPGIKSLLAVITASIDNRFSYYTDMEHGKPVFFLNTESRTEKISFLKKTFDINAIKPLSGETYCIKEYDAGKHPAIYCKLYYDAIAVISGDIDAKRALELLKESEAPDNLMNLGKNNNPMQIFIQHDKEPVPSAVAVDMKDSRINIKIKVNPLLVKKFIPVALLEKSKDANIQSSLSN